MPTFYFSIISPNCKMNIMLHSPEQ